MNRYYGKIGFYVTEETKPGVWMEHFIERYYYGEISKFSRRSDTPKKVNDDLSISNIISIIADPYAVNHFFAMKYLEFSGALWKITNVEVQSPRLILTLGGLWQNEQA